MITKRIIVSGKVQGVFFRQSTKKFAEERGITGNVQNKVDGTVHIVATGPETGITQLEAWCWQGPPMANVNSVEITELPLQLFPGFSII